jgi:transposase InsO family protein
VDRLIELFLSRRSTLAPRFVIHDRDAIYSEGVDATLTAMGLTVLKTPVRAPQANTFCEQLVGTIRRECLDFVIPLNERLLLRHILQTWVAHYNRGRPHASLRPGTRSSPSSTTTPTL